MCLFNKWHLLCTQIGFQVIMRKEGRKKKGRNAGGGGGRKVSVKCPCLASDSSYIRISCYLGIKGNSNM